MSGYLKFTELSDEAKKVAVEGFMEDAKAFEFEGEKDLNAKEVAELLSQNYETHRYNKDGVVIGKVSTYFSWEKQGYIEVFSPGGEY